MMNRIDIHTERLHIRYFIQDDLHSNHQLKKEAFQSKASLEDTQSWLTWTISNYQELARLHQPPYGDYAIELKATGSVIGSVGIVQSIIPWGVLDGKPREEHHHRVSPEFGLFWAILPEYQRQGYATEAGRAIIDYLFNEWNVKQVVATTEFENIASQKSMEKLGMTLLLNPTKKPFWCQVTGLLIHPKQ
jgi:[ribosomal protein S5]-alanine N-acetyltransferase